MSVRSLWIMVLLVFSLSLALTLSCGDDGGEEDEGSDPDSEADGEGDLYLDDGGGGDAPNKIDGCCYYMCTDGETGSYDSLDSEGWDPSQCNVKAAEICQKIGLENSFYEPDCSTCDQCDPPEWWS